MTSDKQVGSLERLGPAFNNSIAGLKAAYQYEMAFKQEVILFVIFTPIAFVIANGFIEVAILMSALFGILITELLNSGIEAVVDRVGLEHHELSGRAKDLGSAAVLMAIAYFLLVWGYKIITYFFY